MEWSGNGKTGTICLGPTLRSAQVRELWSAVLAAAVWKTTGFRRHATRTRTLTVDSNNKKDRFTPLNLIVNIKSIVESIVVLLDCFENEFGIYRFLLAVFQTRLMSLFIL